MHNTGLDPDPYLDGFEDFGINLKVDRSALAHISRLNEEYNDLVKDNYHGLPRSEPLGYFNQLVNERLTTYKGRKGYATPLEVLCTELGKRNLI